MSSTSTFARTRGPARAAVLLAFVGLVFCAGSAQALPDDPRVTLTPMVGVGVMSEFSGAHDDIYYGGALGFMFGYHWGVEGTLGYVPTIERDGGRETTLRHLSADLLYKPLHHTWAQPYFTLGWSELYIDPEGQGGGPGDADGFSYGVGVLFPFGEGPFHRWSARFDFKHQMVEFDDAGIPDDGFHHNFYATAGVQFEFGDDWHKDLDSDGVIDRYDDCLGTLDRVIVDARGCGIDTDSDGMFDGLDECPGTPLGAVVDSLGCPSDVDGDGVPDGIDMCNDTIQGARIDAQGCPIDSDGDGVFDGLDVCEDTPIGIPVTLDGCPQIESDPEREFYRTKIIILQDLTFRTGGSDVLSGITATIRLVVRVMEKWPDAKIEVGGYTDSQGPDANNLRLSQDRAEAVRQLILDRYDWITEDRITAVGYGEANPIADNNTNAGRERNRRIEIKLLEGGARDY